MINLQRDQFFPLFVFASGLLHVGFVLSVRLASSFKFTPNIDLTEIEFLAPVKAASTGQIFEKTLVTKKVKKIEAAPILQSETTSAEIASLESTKSPAQPSFSGSSSGIRDSYTRDLLMLIHQRKVYPRMAQKMGHKGRILAQLRISEDGSILEKKIIEKSPYLTLNEAAEKLLQNLPNLKPFPSEIPEKEWVFNIPIEYKI